MLRLDTDVRGHMEVVTRNGWKGPCKTKTTDSAEISWSGQFFVWVLLITPHSRGERESVSDIAKRHSDHGDRTNWGLPLRLAGNFYGDFCLRCVFIWSFFFSAFAIYSVFRGCFNLVILSTCSAVVLVYLSTICFSCCWFLFFGFYQLQSNEAYISWLVTIHQHYESRSDELPAKCIGYPFRPSF